jgi:type I restriction enzyme S subunit
MSEWKAIQLGDHVNILSGFPFPSDGFSQEEGLPLIRIRDLLADEVETYFIGPYPDDFVINNDDILIGMDGDFNIVRWYKGEALLNQRVCKVFTSTPELDDGYLFWLLSPELQDIHQKTPQTTVKHLSVRDLSQVGIEVPPVNEQRLIAHILDTLDTQIQKTEALIAKLEKVKEGLLHDLLTRGIGENGRLRPSPEQAPEFYKESPLGLVPREWYISYAGEVFEITSGVTLGTHRRPRKNPIPYLRVANVHRDRLVLDEITMLEMTPAELQAKALVAGDLLIVEGHANPNEIGRCAKVSREAAGLTFQNHLFRLRAQDMLAGFASLWMNSNLARGYWRATCSTSSGLYTINRTQLSGVPVANPSKSEQELICSEYDKIQFRLKTEAGQLAKLQLQKKGLMDDLLTGRVRVTPLLDQAQATIPA